MSARTKTRKRALDVLYEADQRGPGLDPDRVRAMLAARMRESGRQTALPEYSVELVEGVADHLAEIDELLSTYSHGWTLDRMPSVDRCVLRLATWELLHNDDVPDAVVLDEAVDLVADLSTDESPGFVNGLLARILEIKPTLGPA